MSMHPVSFAPRWALLAAAALAPWSVGACAPSEPASSPSSQPSPVEEGVQRWVECDQLIDQINLELYAIRDRTLAAARGPGATPADLLDIAGLYDTLADSIASLDLSAPELQGLAGRYRRLARSVSAVTHRMARSAAARDPGGMDEAQREIEALIREEASLVDEINAVCLRRATTQA